MAGRRATTTGPFPFRKLKIKTLVLSSPPRPGRPGANGAPLVGCSGGIAPGGRVGARVALLGRRMHVQVRVEQRPRRRVRRVRPAVSRVCSRFSPPPPLIPSVPGEGGAWRQPAFLVLRR